MCSYFTNVPKTKKEKTHTKYGTIHLCGIVTAVPSLTFQGFAQLWLCYCEIIPTVFPRTPLLMNYSVPEQKAVGFKSTSTVRGSPSSTKLFPQVREFHHCKISYYNFLNFCASIICIQSVYQPNQPIEYKQLWHTENEAVLDFELVIIPHSARSGHYPQ